MKTFITIIVTAVVCLVAFFGISMAVKARMDAKKNKGTMVRIENPVRGELVETITAPGQIEPRRQVEISAKISARIVALPFLEGQKVFSADSSISPPRESDVLVRLDASDIEAQLREVEARRAAQAAQIEVSKALLESKRATLDSSRALLEKSKRVLDRKLKLLKTNDVSPSEVDDAQSVYDDQQAQLRSAQYSLEADILSLTVQEHNLDARDAEIAMTHQRLSYTTMTSPINGVVIRVNAEVGEIAMTGTMNNPGTVILVVADLSQMIVTTHVDEADVSHVNVGQKALVHI